MGFYDSSQLAIEQKHLLIYPTAIYFFVGQSNLKLAERIEYGLLKAIDDGSFERLSTEYPSHKEAFKAANMKNRKVHLLSNPLLPEATPIDNQNYGINYLRMLNQGFRATNLA